MTEPNGMPYDQDEISISELLMKLWAKRGLIVFLPLALAGLTTVGLLASKTQTNELGVLSYYVELNGITNRNMVSGGNGNGDDAMEIRYPNGVVFSPQDLVNPAVLVDLESEYKAPVSALARHVDVRFGSPLSNGVRLEYEAALAANSEADALTLAAINDRYQAKISTTAKRGLKISVDFVALELSREKGEKLAIDLPRTWSRIYTTQFKTRFTPEVITQKMPRYELDLTSAIGFLAAENQLKLIQKSTRALARDGRLAGLTDGNGATAMDLLGYIEDFRAIYFDPLYRNAFAQRSQWSDIYLQNMQLEVDVLSEEIEELNRRLNDLQEYQRGANVASRGGSTQLDGIGLSEVVSLAREAGLSSYLKQTLDQRSLVSSQRSDFQKRMRRIENASVEGDIVVSEEFGQVAVARYQHVVAGYSKLIELARGMLIKQTPTYFSAITQPASPSPTPLVTRSDKLSLALALVLGVMLAIIVALLWPQREK